MKAHRALDYFIHPDLFGDPDGLFRARLLVAILPLYSLVVMAALAILLVMQVPVLSLLFGGGICVAATLAFTLILLRLRRTTHYGPYCAAATAITFSAITFGVAVSGGLTESPVTPVMVVPVLTAYFFGGRRWGNFAVAISFATVAGFLIAELAGVHILQTVSSAGEMRIVRLTVIFVALSAVSGLGLVYELSASALRRERDAEHQKLNHLAETDSLTGLANRRKFESELNKLIAARKTTSIPRNFLLCCIDLDGFKAINDQHGHDVGDEVLQSLSRRFLELSRPGDVVGRLGGDEFMLIFDAASAPTRVKELANRIIASIEVPIPTRAGALRAGASLGFAQYPGDGDSMTSLKRSADMAMYEAKRERGGWRLFGSGSRALAATPAAAMSGRPDAR